MSRYVFIIGNPFFKVNHRNESKFFEIKLEITFYSFYHEGEIILYTPYALIPIQYQMLCFYLTIPYSRLKNIVLL